MIAQHIQMSVMLESDQNMKCMEQVDCSVKNHVSRSSEVSFGLFGEIMIDLSVEMKEHLDNYASEAVLRKY